MATQLCCGNSEQPWSVVASRPDSEAKPLNNIPDKGLQQPSDPVVSKFPEHQLWDEGKGWKNLLNNLRLVIQPYQFFNLLKPWLRVFPISHLSVGFFTLIALMNRMRGAIPDISYSEDFLFSSA